MIKERDWLTIETGQKNFLLIDKLTKKAQIKFKKQQEISKQEKIQAAEQKRDLMEETEKLADELQKYK